MTEKEIINKIKPILEELSYPSAVSYLTLNDKKWLKATIKAIEQEPKTGHWIRWYEQKETKWCIENIPHCKCSECGKEYDPHSSQFIKYCNECGAKMQESEGV